MAYIAPGTVAAGDVYTAASHNIIVNDVIDIYESVKRRGYQERTSQHISASTTFAGASNLFTTDITFTSDGLSIYRIDFFSPFSDNSAAGRDLFISLSVSGTETGRTQIFNVTGRGGAPVWISRYLTPSAGSRTVNFRHYHAGGATELIGAGGTGSALMPMYMAVYGPVLT